MVDRDGPQMTEQFTSNLEYVVLSWVSWKRTRAKWNERVHFYLTCLWGKHAHVLMISLSMRHFTYREAWDRMKMNVVLSLVLIGSMSHDTLR
jgi:uncharacterized membrane protein SirB2